MNQSRFLRIVLLVCAIIGFIFSAQAQYEKGRDSSSNDDTTKNLIGSFGVDVLFGNGNPSFGLDLKIDHLKGLGGEVRWYSSFRKYSPIPIDIGINYSYPAYQNDNLSVYPTFAIGPSLYIPNGNGDKFHFNGFFTLRASVNYKKFIASIGWYCMNPEWKFKELGHAGYASIGYSF